MDGWAPLDLWAESLRSLPAGREQRAHMFVDAAHAEEPDENGLATLHLAGYVRGKLIGSARCGTHGCCSGARLQHSRLPAGGTPTGLHMNHSRSAAHGAVRLWFVCLFA